MDPDAEAPANPEEIWTVSVDGSGLVKIPLPEEPGCLRTRYQNPFVLDAERVGVVQACDTPGAAEPVSYALLAIDPTNQQAASVISDGRLGGLNSSAVPIVAANPTQDIAIASVGDVLCGSLVQIDSSGAQPIDLTLDDEDGSWNLSEFFGEAASCADQGRAAWPAWSSQGSFAFFGSPQSIGVSGMARALEPWNLYSWVPGSATATLLLSDVHSARALAWSPDGEWLAFVGGIEDEEGLWLLPADSTAPVHVSNDNVISLAWSPDGTTLAGTIPVGTDTLPPRQIVTYDVTRIVEAEA